MIIKRIKYIFLALICIALIAIDFLVPIKESKENVMNVKNYKFAINVQQWCWSHPNSRGSYKSFIRLSQLIDGYALFLGEGYKIAIPLNQLKQDIKQGQTLGKTADYIGGAGKISMTNISGFKTEVELFHIISRKQFNKAKTRLDGSNCKR
jgi:hypothetical protein